MPMQGQSKCAAEALSQHEMCLKSAAWCVPLACSLNQPATSTQAWTSRGCLVPGILQERRCNVSAGQPADAPSEGLPARRARRRAGWRPGTAAGASSCVPAWRPAAQAQGRGCRVSAPSPAKPAGHCSLDPATRRLPAGPAHLRARELQNSQRLAQRLQLVGAVQRLHTRALAGCGDGHEMQAAALANSWKGTALRRPSPCSCMPTALCMRSCTGPMAKNGGKLSAHQQCPERAAWPPPAAGPAAPPRPPGPASWQPHP